MMPEEGGKGAAATSALFLRGRGGARGGGRGGARGGEGDKKCSAQVHISIVVVSLFAPISASWLEEIHIKIAIKVQERDKMLFKSCAIANSRIFILN